MTDLHALKDEIDAHAINTRELLERAAYALIAQRKHDVAGAALVAERIMSQHFGHVLAALASIVAMEAPPEPARPTRGAPAGKRAPKGQGQHRHKFDGAGKCSCGAERQRAPKGSAAPAQRPSAEALTVSLLPIGDDRPDRFDGGAFGTSSATERTR